MRKVQCRNDCVEPAIATDEDWQFHGIIEILTDLFRNVRIQNVSQNCFSLGTCPAHLVRKTGTAKSEGDCPRMTNKFIDVVPGIANGRLFLLHLLLEVVYRTGIHFTSD
jgi:hypothetical protein